MDFLLSCLLLDCISCFLRLGLEFERTVEGQPTGRLLRPSSTLSLLLRLSKIRSSLPLVTLVLSRSGSRFLLPIAIAFLEIRSIGGTLFIYSSVPIFAVRCRWWRRTHRVRSCSGRRVSGHRLLLQLCQLHPVIISRSRGRIAE